MVGKNGLRLGLRWGALWMAVLLLISAASGSVFALSSDEYYIYSNNDIYFYDPYGENCIAGSVATTLTGDNNAVKIWNWFVNAGIAGVSDNAAVISGIIGNLQAESGLNPLSRGGGLGLFQVTRGSGQRDEFLSYLARYGISESDFGTTGDTAKNDAAITATLEYLTLGKNNGGFDAWDAFVANLGVVTGEGAEAAAGFAELFLVVVENAYATDAVPGQPLQNDGVINTYGNTRRWQGHDARVRYAREIYNTYGTTTSSTGDGVASSTNTATASSICNSGGGSGVTGGGVTTAEINGYRYAFPIAQATKANYLDGTNGYYSVLSAPTSWYHHDYMALDLGIAMELVDGKARTQNGNSDDSFYGTSSNGGTFVDYYFYSTEAEVVAIVGGTIEQVNLQYTADNVPSDWQNKCGTIFLQGEDGHRYFMAHIDAASISVGVGQTVTAGQRLAQIGSPYCAQSTQSHLHIDSDRRNGSRPQTDMKPLIQALYDALPADAAELAEREAGNSGLVSGGMTLAQAQTFMAAYATESDKFSRGTLNFQGATVNDAGCPSGTLNNCSAFTQWFLNKYTTLGPNGAQLIQGSRAVSYNLSAHPELVDGGKTPKAYAIMSTGPYTGSADGWRNHTGIVLGIDAANDQIIIGEASCGSDKGARWYRPRAQVYSLSTYTNSSSQYGPTYAYTDAILSGL